MYEAWQKDPSSVHKSWDAYFRNVNAGAPIGQAVSTPPSISSLPSFTGFSVPSQSTSPDSVKINLLVRSASLLFYLFHAFILFCLNN